MSRAFPTRRSMMPWLIGLALIVRALVPSGWMTAAAGGGIALVPCTGVMAAAAAMPAHGGDHAAPADHAGHHGDGERQDGDGKPPQPCAFAALALAWLPSASPLLAAPVPMPLADEPPARAPAHALRPAAAPPPSTGPPIA